MKKLLIEALIIVFIFALWGIRAINLAMAGNIMIVFGVLILVVVVISLLGIRVFTGNVSTILPINEIVGIKTIKKGASFFYALLILGLGSIPIIAGILILLFSRK
jgi:hypothetical protein